MESSIHCSAGIGGRPARIIDKVELVEPFVGRGKDGLAKNIRLRVMFFQITHVYDAIMHKICRFYAGNADLSGGFHQTGDNDSSMRVKLPVTHAFCIITLKSINICGL